MFNEHTQRIRHLISKIHSQRVLVHQQRVAQPIGDRVFLRISLHNEGIVAIEIQTTDDGQLLAAIAEEDVDAVGILTLRLQQVTVCLLFLESRQYHIVRVVVHIVHLCNAVDMQRIAPDSVLAHVWLHVGLVGLVREGYHLALLRELIVTISILQGIDAVFAFRNALDDKVTVGIGTSHTQ